MKTAYLNLSLIILVGVAMLSIAFTQQEKSQNQENSVQFLSGMALGMPVALPPFDPARHIPEPPDYSRADCWVSKPEWFSKEEKLLMFLGFTRPFFQTAQAI